jgi:type IV pilus assembly protein PilE
MRLTKNKNKKRNGTNGFCHGFSLVEMMVVAVILAILAAIVYPSYLESIRKAKRAEGRAAMMALMQQQERYYSQHNSYIVFSPSDANGFKWFSANNPATSSYEISATACSEDDIQNCVLLTAKPGTANVNAGYKDDACGNLMLTSTGMKAAAGRAENCWE